jgi:glycosyltransferase involved in cell wall biosynthesis
LRRNRLQQATFRFLPYQDRAVLKYSLSVPDAHWLSLNPALEGLLVPSKLYGILAAGRPVIAVAAKDGEIAELVERNSCGFAVAPGDAGALAEILAALAQDPARCAEMGRRARALLEAKFSRAQAFELWQKLIAKIGAASAPA